MTKLALPLMAFFLSACASAYQADPAAEIMLKATNNTACDVVVSAVRQGGFESVTLPVQRRYGDDEPSVAVKFVRHSALGFGPISWRLRTNCNGWPTVLEADGETRLPNVPLAVRVEVRNPLKTSSVEVVPR